jgi:hypothetical protein
MENTAIVLIALTLLLLVLILGLLTFLIYRLTKQNLNQTPAHPPQMEEQPEVANTTRYHPDVLQRMKEAEKHKAKKSDLFCPNHPNEPGETTCAICDRFFCKTCIKPFKSLHFCKEHLPLLMRHEWSEVLTLKTSTQDPEDGVRLYDLKKELFHREGLCTFIETHYKINVDQDYIETYLVLFAMTEAAEKAKEKFSSDSLN